MPKLKDLKNKSLTIKKPNRTITISSDKLSLVQRKAYNTLLRHTQAALRLKSDQSIFEMPVQIIKEQAGIKKHDAGLLKEQLEALMKIVVSCVEVDTGWWRSFVILAEARVENSTLIYAFPPTILQALIDNDFYTTLDLMVIQTFRSKYALILYEIAMRYRNVEIPEYDIATFKRVMGTNWSFGNIKQRILDPAIAEIKLKSDIELSYTTKSGGRGGKVIAIKFHIKNKPELLPELEETVKETVLPIQQNVSPLLSELISLKLSLRQSKTILEKYSEDIIKRNIEYVKVKGGLQRPVGYLIEAIKADYAKDQPNPNTAVLVKKARECYAKCNGSCGGEWKNHKENKQSICFHCAKFIKKL
jgi:hypothetical protein